MLSYGGTTMNKGTILYKCISSRGCFLRYPKERHHLFQVSDSTWNILYIQLLFTGFTMLCAAGPFTTSDNLDFRPLHGLLDVVRTEEPDVLLLVS